MLHTRETGAPLHHQIFSILRSGIITGRYPKGELLPSETTLMDQYGVSRATVRRAMLSLELEGLIERRQGLGTRVTKTMRQINLTHGPGVSGNDVVPTQVRIVEFATVAASPQIQEMLNLPEDAPVTRIVRIRETAEGLPMRMLVNTLSATIGSKIVPEEIGNFTLTEVLSTIGYNCTRAIDIIGATLADPGIAGYLQVKSGSPLIEVNRKVIDDNDRPIMHQLALIPPERHRFRIEVTASDLGLPHSGASGQLIAPE